MVENGWNDFLGHSYLVVTFAELHILRVLNTAFKLL